MSPVKPYIGGPFELDFELFANRPVQRAEDYFGLGRGDVLLQSGRAAFRTVLRGLNLDGRSILIPDFLCGDVFVPLLKAEVVQYRFYPVNEDLGIDVERLLDLADGGADAVLLINYFGLSDYHELARELRSRNESLAIVLDSAQALYDSRRDAPARAWADYLFVSLRKFLSVPDGAFVVSRAPIACNLTRTEDGGGAYYIMGAGLRHAFLWGAVDPARAAETEAAYMKFFEKAADCVSTEPQPMSVFSRELVARLPLDRFAAQRRENYAFLADALDGIPGLTVLRPRLPETATPLAMPVRVANGSRDALRAHLMKRNIYCPVHWPLIKELEQNAPSRRIRLSASIMSLPVDQRYTPSDLGRVVEAIQEFEAER
ncbi:MAG: DegT/DnrJ/EryC1/StrS family aminotransferase [Alphaproteobacteria bacterium]